MKGDYFLLGLILCIICSMAMGAIIVTALTLFTE
jgi:hypothetical protein